MNLNKKFEKEKLDLNTKIMKLREELRLESENSKFLEQRINEQGKNISQKQEEITNFIKQKFEFEKLIEQKDLELADFHNQQRFLDEQIIEKMEERGGFRRYHRSHGSSSPSQSMTI